MHLQEVVLCATAPNAQSAGSGTIALHDIQTGTVLASYKQTSAGTHCTAVAPSRDGQGGFMLAAQTDKSIMNVYNFQKDQLALKIVLPEKLSCISIDPRGMYCAAGTSQGRVYLWEIASGIMYAAWDAHYRQVSVLRFTQDGQALLSGSEDSGVNVWLISRLVDDTLQNDLPTPYCIFGDHTLPITDIACGVGAFPRCRVLTASVDHSVKMWDLSSCTLLTTFQFPRPISLLAWDLTERLFFAASADGAIHQVNLFKQREDKSNRILEAIGGTGLTDVIRLTDDDQENTKKRLISVGHPLTCLCLSLTSSLLLAGTATGLIQLYDTGTHQLLRSISTHKGLAITHLETMLKPPDVIGHFSFSLGAQARETIPPRPVAAFQRMKDPKTKDAHEVSLVLPPLRTKWSETSFEYTTDEMLRDYSVFVQPDAGGGQPTGASLQTRVTELETEVGRLREQLAKAKGINDTMWETVVQRLVAEGKEKQRGHEGRSRADEAAMDVDDAGDAQRRKRGRT